MIELKVFGATPPCAKCKEVEKRAKNVAEKYPGQVTVTKLEAVSEEGQKLQIFFTPAVAVNGKVISTGEVISEADLEKAVMGAME